MGVGLIGALGGLADTISNDGSKSFLTRLNENVNAQNNLNVGSDIPSAIQEYNFYSQLDPEAQKRYMSIKRAQQIVNLGGTQGVLNQTGGGLAQQFPVTPKPEQMPDFQGQQEAAKKKAELQETTAADLSKKSRGAQNTLDILDKAEALLPQATGSGIGALAASAQSALGVSTDKTKANEQLKMLSGWLVSNVPRMEGPQSNFDVENYKTMAANIGDMSKPIGDRIASLKGLRELQQKYVDKNTDSQPQVQTQQAMPSREQAIQELKRRGILK